MSFHPAVKPPMQPARPAMVLHQLGQLMLIPGALFSVLSAFPAVSGDLV